MTDVVGDSARQRQCEQGVRKRQVDQIDGGGVELVLPLAHHIENQAVSTHADDKNHRVESREKDGSRPLVDKHITAALVERVFSRADGDADVVSSHPTCQSLERPHMSVSAVKTKQ